MNNEINNELEKTLDYLQDEVIPSLKKEIEEKQKRIDKAIEYIDNWCLEEDGYVGYGDDLDPEELVNILKGKGKE